MISTAAATLEHSAATKVDQATRIEQMLQELSDSINAYVQAQKEENQRFWTYLIHLEAKKHQFARYMKSKHANFPKSSCNNLIFQRAEKVIPV